MADICSETGLFAKGGGGALNVLRSHPTLMHSPPKIECAPQRLQRLFCARRPAGGMSPHHHNHDCSAPARLPLPDWRASAFSLDASSFEIFQGSKSVKKSEAAEPKLNCGWCSGTRLRVQQSKPIDGIRTASSGLLFLARPSFLEWLMSSWCLT